MDAIYPRVLIQPLSAWTEASYRLLHFSKPNKGGHFAALKQPRLFAEDLWFQSASALMYLFLARRKARTLELLAAKLNIPPQTLKETVHAYNLTAKSQDDDPMGKPRDYCKPLQSGPWYALDCRIDGIVRNPSITLGGLVVDEASG